MRLFDALPPVGELAQQMRERLTPTEASGGADAKVRALSAEDLQHCLKDALARVLERARSELERLQNRVSQLEHELESEREGRREVETLLREASSALERAAETRAALEDELLEAQAALEHVEQLEANLRARETELERVNRDLVSERERAKTLESDLEEARARLADALVEIEQLRKELTDERTVELATFEERNRGESVATLGEASPVVGGTEASSKDETLDLPAIELPLTTSCVENETQAPTALPERAEALVPCGGADFEALGDVCIAADVLERVEERDCAVAENGQQVPAESLAVAGEAPEVDDTVRLPAPDPTSVALDPEPRIDDTVRLPALVDANAKRASVEVGTESASLLAALASLPALEPREKSAHEQDFEPIERAAPEAASSSVAASLPTVDELFGRTRPQPSRNTASKRLAARRVDAVRRGSIKAIGFGQAQSGRAGMFTPEFGGDGGR